MSNNIEDFYVLGEPIETDIGNVQFIRVKDYPYYLGDMQIFSWSKQEIIYNFQKINKDNQLDDWIAQIEQLPFYELTTKLPELVSAYTRMFTKVFEDIDMLKMINQDNFEYYRSLIMRMNGLKEEEINPNPEIQKAIERSRRVKSQEKDDTHFSDIVSSVVVYSGIDYEKVINWTLLQLYHAFHRISHFKNYDTSILFSTVSSEKINIKSWGTHVDLFEKEKHFVTQDEFKKSTGKVFDE